MKLIISTTFECYKKSLNMKFIYSFLVLLLMGIGVNAQTCCKLKTERRIPVRIVSEVQSNLKTNQEVRAVIDSDIMDDNGEYVLIKKGTPVELRTDIVKARPAGKPGMISMDFLSTQAVDGQTVYLAGKYTQEGKDKRGITLGLSITGGVLFFPPVLFCLFIKGGKVCVPANTLVYDVYVRDLCNVKTASL